MANRTDYPLPPQQLYLFQVTHYRKMTTGKRGNCECIATWGRPKPRQSFAALITTPCQVWSRWTYPLPYYSVFAADTLLYTVSVTPDPVTLTIDLWPWTFAAYRLWCDKTLCQIWTQSSNPQQSYSDFNIWPYDLKHVLRVVLGSEIIFTNFDLQQLICAWIIAFLILICYVMLWPWPLTRWHQASRDQSLYKIWA